MSFSPCFLISGGTGLKSGPAAVMPYITMCQGPKCTANGAGLIIRDMEDLAQGVACVEASGCVGQCSKGPNGMYSEKSGAKGKITNKLNKYSKLTEMLNDVIQGFALDDLQSRVHKIKFAIRREENADTRMQAIEETLSSFDGQQKQLHPELVAQMLCLRSREMMKADPSAAYNDLRDALILRPDWPWAFVTLAQVLDNLHMPRGALACMQKAIEIGTGVDKNALTRGMVRLERKAADSKGPDVPPAGIEMDIRYIKEKSLAGGESQKQPKDKEKKEKGEKSEKSDKREKKVTKDGKEVKASKAKSKSKKDGSGKKEKEKANAEDAEKAAKEKLELEKANEMEPAAEAAETNDVPEEAPKTRQESKPKEEKKVPKPASEPKDGAENMVVKSVEAFKDIVMQKEVRPKNLEKAKSKDEKEKKKKKTKKKKPEKSDAAAGEYQDWQLRNSEWANHDCLRMTFACKGKASKSFESPIWHIDLAANIGEDGEEIQRSYTPLSNAEDYKKGVLVLLIKVYPTGKMSSYLGKMKAGDSILVSRPVATVDPQEYPEGAIMVAGGSAVVVALQVATAMLPQIADSFHLYLCNRKQPDVLLMDEFNVLLEAYPKFHMTNCLSQDQSPENPGGRSSWSSGRLNTELLSGAPQNLKVIMSGPDPLCKMVAQTFMEMGKQEDDIACLDTDLDDLLHPDGGEEEVLISKMKSSPQLPPAEKTEEQRVEVPRARIKASKSQVISIDSLVSPVIAKPVAGLGLFSSLFLCGCKPTDAFSEDIHEDSVKQKR